ncbi:type II toxin-antitoxin system RelE family toxin [Salicibibacter kimchii]|nr:type II toxin-antitoxin system RelE/ParE family toxin [Salicibibacter kimchii]
MYSIQFSKDARKQLNKLDKNTAKRIINSIEKLQYSPREHRHSKKMKGYKDNIYRLRVGQFRIIYEIIEEKVVVLIVRLGSRGDIYK